MATGEADPLLEPAGAPDDPEVTEPQYADPIYPIYGDSMLPDDYSKLSVLLMCCKCTAF